MFEECAINVVVRGISIDESVKEQCIEREAPVLRRRSVFVVCPFSRVFQRVDCLLISIQIVVHPCRIVVVR